MKSGPIDRIHTKEKLKDILILCMFILCSAILSTIVMDAIIFPLSIFATGSTEIFTFVAKEILSVIIIVVFIFLLIKRIIKYRKEGYTFKEITGSLGLRPLKILSTFIISLFVIAGLISLIYLIFSYNNYLLYTLTNM